MPSDQHSRYSALRLHHFVYMRPPQRDATLPRALRVFSTPPFHCPFSWRVFRSLTLTCCFGSLSESPSAFAYGFGPSRRALAFPAELVSPGSRAAKAAFPRTHTHTP
ncbi:hypothetical protein K438DRAFT_1817368 [Mycena galopus ATCC 62051]|nr:hypothetical protein K438DRAFT_1817368 [Mycena galopus ATCC 62051]